MNPSPTGDCGGALDALEIRKPCPADWSAMRGDDRVRFCQLCRLKVYDLSQMTRPEAEGLLEKSEGRVCVRLHRRADGTVLTRDCGERRRDLFVRKVALVAAAGIFLGAQALALVRPGRPGGRIGQRGFDALRQTSVYRSSPRFAGWVDAAGMRLGMAFPRMIMGDVCVTPLMGESAPQPLMGSPVPAPPQPEPLVGKIIRLPDRTPGAATEPPK